MSILQVFTLLGALGMFHMDIMNAYERMGDFIINISQDLERGFIHK